MAVRTPQPPSRHEPLKRAAVVVLAVVLAAVLLWPADDASEPASTEGEPRRLPGEAVIAGTPARSAAGAPAGAEGIAGTPATASAAEAMKLPRLDVERIAAADPFVASSETSSDQLDTAGADRVLTSASTEIRAVYRTARGAVAIVNDQIVPVTDAKKWIESMRSADADP